MPNTWHFLSGCTFIIVPSTNKREGSIEFLKLRAPENQVGAPLLQARVYHSSLRFRIKAALAEINSYLLYGTNAAVRRKLVPEQRTTCSTLPQQPGARATSKYAPSSATRRTRRCIVHTPSDHFHCRFSRRQVYSIGPAIRKCPLGRK